MSGPARRLVGFALVLAGTFGSAYALGERLPGHSHTHSHDTATDTYRLGPEPDGDFIVRDTGGRAVTRLAKVHGALLHVIAVRPDGSDFHHVHPAIGADGSFAVALPDTGPWSVFAEGRATGSDRGFLARYDIAGDAAFTPSEPDPVANSAVITTSSGQQIAVTRRGLRFTINAAAPLEPYLEMPGHLVALRLGDLSFSHLHATAPSPTELEFTPPLTADGVYRAYLQFGYQGEVITVPMTLDVVDGKLVGGDSGTNPNPHGGHDGG